MSDIKTKFQFGGFYSMYTIYNPWSSKLSTCSSNQTPHPETTCFVKILMFADFQKVVNWLFLQIGKLIIGIFCHKNFIKVAFFSERMEIKRGEIDIGRN